MILFSKISATKIKQVNAKDTRHLVHYHHTDALKSSYRVAKLNPLQQKYAHYKTFYISHNRFYGQYKGTATQLNKPFTYYTVAKRYMFKHIVGKVTRIHHDPMPLYKMTTRNACTHAGTIKPLKPLPKVNTTDATGNHNIVFHTYCKETNCQIVNCADVNEPNVKCPNRTAQENAHFDIIKKTL